LGGVLLVLIVGCSGNPVLNPNSNSDPAYSYEVTFDSQSADVAADPAQKNVVDPATSVGTFPTPPTKAGYTFRGWWLVDPWTGTQFETDTVVSADVTVYARWAFTVEFDSVGGTAVDTQYVQPGSTVVEPVDPTLTGYAFNGWLEGASQWDFASAVSSAMTLEADWNPENYTVTFDPAGGTVDPTSGEVTYAATYGALPEPTRSGYWFRGWYTLTGGAGTQVLAGTEVTRTEDHTIYADWELATAQLDVSIDVSNPAESEISISGDAVLSKSGSGYSSTMVISTNSGAESYTWLLDENSSHAAVTVSPDYTAEINAASLDFGIHTLNVFVEVSSGEYRSAQFDFEVVE
jgi:uncharacterized repeat protein (TIGR02543 family)